MAIPAAILRAQRASLFGLGGDRYTYAPRATEDAGFAIYSGPGTALGADLPAYDLNAPGAIQELKRALVALAAFESDVFKKAGAPSYVGVATEQTWKAITDNDDWDGPAGEELLLAVSRYRGLDWQIGEPYVQMGLPGGLPQPAVNGLELVAGAVRQRLGGAAVMTKYEAWRAQGCLLQATCMAPPSAISKPPDATPVTPTFQGLRLVPPVGADPAMLAVLAAADVAQQALWQPALLASTEPERAALASSMTRSRAARDAAAQAAIDSTPGRQGTPVDTAREVACVAQGGIWSQDAQACTMPAVQPGPAPSQASLAGPLAVLAAAALGIWWVTKKKGSRR